MTLPTDPSRSPSSTPRTDAIYCPDMGTLLVVPTEEAYEHACQLERELGELFKLSNIAINKLAEAREALASRSERARNEELRIQDDANDILTRRLEQAEPDAKRYIARRSQAYFLGRVDGDSEDYEAFCAAYDAASDAAMTTGGERGPV